MRFQRSRGDGFTLLEMMVTIAIVAILFALTVGAFSSLKGTIGRRSMALDLYSELNLARTRARFVERTQVVVIDATLGGNGYYGYYHFEDSGTPPTLFNGAQLQTLMSKMTNPPTLPAGYTLTLREQRTSLLNGYYLSADAWNGPLPFPWTPLTPTASPKLSTTGGCSFCSGGYGAVAFLPGGRAVFSDNNNLGGFIVIAGETAGSTTNVRSGIGISPLGFVQQVEQK
jgi:prepilin-type N-terminal cleavage/methylation domain-containing protein